MMIRRLFSIQAIIFVAMMLMAFLLRSYRYEQFPVAGETADEYAWAMLGASLIEEGVPASWSYFAAYDNYRYQEGIYDAPIVRPALDHPPLFALLPGLFHALKAFWLDYPSIKVIRLPLLLLGSLNVGLFWLMLKKVFRQPGWQFLGVLLFMTIPEIVWGSRLAVAENLLITWVLLAMLALSSAHKHAGRWLVILSAAAVLTKVAGLILPGSLIVYGLLHQRPKLAKQVTLGALLGLGGFALYGALYNWELFSAVWSAQSSRVLGLVTLQNRLFLHPALVQHTLFDGWKILGLLSMFYLFGKAKLAPLVHFSQIFTLMSLLFVAVSVGETTIHGWYDLVLWPGLVLSLTVMSQEIWQKGRGLLFAFGWLWLLPVFRLVAFFTQQQVQLTNMPVRLIVLVGFIPLALQLLGKKEWLKWAMLLGLALLIAANVAAVLTITHEGYWLQAQVLVREVIF